MLDSDVVPTQRGGITVIGLVGAREMLARIDATPPGHTYFFYPYMPMLPFLTKREHVAKYDIFIPGYTLPSQYHETCLSVFRRANWLVIDRTWIGPKRWKEVYPAMRNAQPRETKDFERALDEGFEFVALDGIYELRRRRKGVGDEICADLAE